MSEQLCSGNQSDEQRTSDQQDISEEVAQQTTGSGELSAQTKTDTSTVVAVRLRYNPKAYWFDPVLSTYKTGDHVLVDTERGREIGLVVEGALEVTQKQLKDIKEPLKPVIRVLGDVDFQRIDELDAKGREAMPIFRELVEKHHLDMKPVSVEYMFTGDKAVFYFSNDDRVDFRELVRDLASRFHIRVDMRQIGVRDEARILGGLAHCGEELCCTRLGGEFQPVSIRMAKEQDLPLNPTKISGACGRLMCCLRYEFEAYKDFKGRAPKKGALIETPIGQAKVIDFDTPREVIQLRLEDGKQLSVPLKDFECNHGQDGKKHPCRISRETIDRCASSSILMALAALEQETAMKETEIKDENQGRGARQVGRRLRREGREKRHKDDSLEQDVIGHAPEPSQRAKRSRFAKTGEDVVPKKRNAKSSRPRPGQHSSGLRSADRADATDGFAHSHKDQEKRKSNDGSGPQEVRSKNKERTPRDSQARSDMKSDRKERSSEGFGGIRRRRRPTNKPNQ